MGDLHIAASFAAVPPPGIAMGDAHTAAPSASSTLADGLQQEAPTWMPYQVWKQFLHQFGGTEDLMTSIVIDVFVLAVAFAIFFVLRRFRRRGADDGLGAYRKKRVPASTVVLNYLCLLEECRTSFLVQTALSAAATIPWWGASPIAVGFGGGTINTAAQLSSTKLCVLCGDTLVRGLVAIFFVERLRKRVRRPILRTRDRELIARTLWLSGLPVYDSETGRPFVFTEADFGQVARDLEQALTEELDSDIIGVRKQRNLKAYIVPVVDKWHKVSKELMQTTELLEAYRADRTIPPPGCWGRFKVGRKALQVRALEALKARLDKDVAQLAREKKRISGAAFVTFSTHAERNRFLLDKPKCWQCRQFAYFSFGRPPFASVTLECTRAVHPDDINWLNLHVTRRWQIVRGAVPTMLLFVAMVFLVTPVTYTSQMSSILPALRERLETVAGWLRAKDFFGGHSVHFWYLFTNQLPAMLLVAINSLLVPECIYRIAIAVRLHKHSSSEIVQLHLNYLFLVLNAVVIPLLGLTSIRALIEWGQRRLGVSPLQLLVNITTKLLQSSGVFAVRYILNCACLSNANCLLQLPQRVYKAISRRNARTAGELVQAEEPWVYAWGYWYAWTISIFTIGTLLSTVIPSVLPCTALFFAVQHFVDGYNLHNNIYRQGPDSENTFITRGLHYLRCVVAGWWVVMGMGFLFVLHQPHADGWDDCYVPLRLVRYVCMVFIFAGSFIMLWSWWDQQSILHDSNFETVDIAGRGVHRNRVFDMFEQWFGANCVYGHGRGRYRGVSGEATDLEGSMDGKPTEMEEALSEAEQGFEIYRMNLEDSSDEEEDQKSPTAIADINTSLSWDVRKTIACVKSLPI